MRVTVTGGSGLIGSRLVALLRARGDEVTVLSRSGTDGAPAWDPLAGPAPVAALEGREAVIPLPASRSRSAGVRPCARRSRPAGRRARRTWWPASRRSRSALGCWSAPTRSGYYGDRGAELLTEASAPGTGYLAEVCVAWERAALGARELGLRVCVLRTGVVLDRHGGALAKMLPPFRLGVGGPVAGGRQYVSWISVDDLTALYAAGARRSPLRGAVNATAPAPVTNAELSRALGRCCSTARRSPRSRRRRWAALRRDGRDRHRQPERDPERALALGYSFRHATLDGALAAALA